MTEITAFSHVRDPVDEIAFLRALFGVCRDRRTKTFAQFHLASANVVQAIAIVLLRIDELVTGWKWFHCKNREKRRRERKNWNYTGRWPLWFWRNAALLGLCCGRWFRTDGPAPVRSRRLGTLLSSSIRWRTPPPIVQRRLLASSYRPADSHWTCRTDPNETIKEEREKLSSVKTVFCLNSG